MFAVKMRASSGGKHISGAERIVDEALVSQTAAALIERALHHAKGTPDFINLKVEVPPTLTTIPALPVSTEAVHTPEEGWSLIEKLLAQEGFSRAAEIRALFRETYSMRGAMLLDADTLERLEPDKERGIRCTYMDEVGRKGTGTSVPDSGTKVPVPVSAKNHFREALVLASKVASAPNIVGEICMSDDPDYVTGYIATKRLGYKRITVLKHVGDPAGGRIFLYRGPRSEVAKTIRYLEKEAILVQV